MLGLRISAWGRLEGALKNGLCSWSVTAVAKEGEQRVLQESSVFRGVHFVMVDFNKGVVDGGFGCADRTIDDYSGNAFGFKFASDPSGDPSQFAGSFVAFDAVSDFGGESIYEFDPLIRVVFLGGCKGFLG